MSEFADSVHFYDLSINEVKNILQANQVKAVILGTYQKTVAVLINWVDKEKILNKAKILSYAYAEDHGLWLHFYNQGSKVAAAELSWDDSGEFDEEYDNPPENTPNLGQILVNNGFIEAKHGNEMDNLLADFAGEDWEIREDLLDRLGEVLNLYTYRWINCDDIVYDLDHLQTEFPELVVVE